MTAKTLKPLPPQPHIPIVVLTADGQVAMAQSWIEWFMAANAVIKDLIGGNLGPLTTGGVIGPLPNIGASGALAANDAAAAALSVVVGGIYRDSVGVVHIRTA
jgi:hypothetical protein